MTAALTDDPVARILQVIANAKPGQPRSHDCERCLRLRANNPQHIVRQAESTVGGIPRAGDSARRVYYQALCVDCRQVEEAERRKSAPGGVKKAGPPAAPAGQPHAAQCECHECMADKSLFPKGYGP